MAGTAFGVLPEPAQRFVKEAVVLANPRVSWRTWRAMPEQFVDALFDDSEEYEAYVTEFWESRIVDVCRSSEEKTREGVTIYDAHRDECERLYALVRKLQPSTLVETGVYHGVSTTSILLALEANGSGTLHSIDRGVPAQAGGLPDETAEHFSRERPSCAEPGTHTIPPDRDPGWIVPADLRDRWTLRNGRIRRELPALLADLDGIDFFLHDSEHSTTGMLFEFDAAWEWLRDGGVIVSHHVGWNDAYETFADERPCDHGLMTYTYYGDYPVPCRSAYLRKP